MQRKVTLAVIMACHNRRESTLSCLRALSQQDKLDNVQIDIYLLDDGSTDGTSEAVRAEFPSINLLCGDGRLFWNRGMHKSFSEAIRKGFDYYLWLNDDSMLYSNALRVLFSTSYSLNEQGHADAIIGSAMQDPITKEFSYGGVKRNVTHLGHVKNIRIHPGIEALQCDASNGNCVLIPASVVDKVGNLDPVYLHRWGDHDFCLRAINHGCSIWLARGYLGTCAQNTDLGTWKDSTLTMMQRFRQLNSPHGFLFRDYATYLRRHQGIWWPLHLFRPYAKIALETLKNSCSKLVLMK